jgi:lipoyl(octanoyl) transferase
MSFPSPRPVLLEPSASTLRVFLLGRVDFDDALRLQRTLAYQASGGRGPALVLCEHPPLITVGRHGGPAELAEGPEELRARRWPVRWVNRGGGCWLHLPGQLAVYPIVPLDRCGLGLEAYLGRLRAVLADLLDDFGVRAEAERGAAGLGVGGRRIAAVGVAVWNWVAYFGATLNINPDLTAFRLLRGGGPATSLARERRGPLSPALVRQRLLEHFCRAFRVDQGGVFFDYPALKGG